jgi:uncharacterized phiE125 gp8 family phage protein
MAAVCTTPPAILAVSIVDAREKIRASADDGLDAQLELSIAGLVAETEAATGHCFMEQGWRVTLDDFPRCAGGDEPIIRLPHPARGVQAVTYVDAAGAEQVLSPAAYEMVTERYQSFLAPVAGSWPATAARRRAVKIDCMAGHGIEPAATPALARQYILARLELEYCPPMNPPTLAQLEGMLAPLKTYG